jgi:addiction module RelE/StbE family toxin
MVKVKLSGKFNANYKELISSDSELESAIWDRITIFHSKSSDTLLRNHKLKGKLKGKWAFSITDDIRIVYEWKSRNVVRFLAIGGHEKVYRKQGKN